MIVGGEVREECRIHAMRDILSMVDYADELLDLLPPDAKVVFRWNDMTNNRKSLKMNLKVNEYLDKLDKWQDETRKLRSVILNCGLTEEFKWRVPCYTFDSKNIVLIGVFKNHCTLSFFKGVLLNDTNGILVAPGENSQSVRMVKFTDIEEIIELEGILEDYIYEAVELEKAGLKVDFKESRELIFNEKLEQELQKDSDFKNAFTSLTPGRQKAYNIYFSAAKQSKTQLSRIEKYKQRILNGKGINDCTCGLSKRLPSCDGSHNKKS